MSQCAAQEFSVVTEVGHWCSTSLPVRVHYNNDYPQTWHIWLEGFEVWGRGSSFPRFPFFTSTSVALKVAQYSHACGCKCGFPAPMTHYSNKNRSELPHPSDTHPGGPPCRPYQELWIRPPLYGPACEGLCTLPVQTSSGQSGPTSAYFGSKPVWKSIKIWKHFKSSTPDKTIGFNVTSLTLKYETYGPFVL